MRTKTFLLASSAVAALSLAAPAQAAGNFYVTVYGGTNWLNDEAFVAVTTPIAATTTFAFAGDADTGFIVGGAIGMSLNQMFAGLRGEVEVAYRQQNVDGPWSSATGLGSYSGVVDYDQSTFSVMANLWYDFAVGGVRPYVGGGVGWARTEVDGNFGPTPTFDIDDNGFAWQLGAGVNFDISPNMMLGVGYRYFAGPEVTILAPGALNPLSGDLESENHSAIVHLTFTM